MNHPGFIVAVESYVLRKGVVTILNRIPGIGVIREFESSSSLKKYIETRDRDLLLISQSLFDQSFHQLFSGGDLQERTIILSHQDAREAGNGLPSIDTGDSKELILKKIHSLLDAQPRGHGESSIFSLSPKEKTIVRLVSLGFTNKQIAGELFLSTHTVITHRKNIGHKLGIKSVSGLTVYAIVNNIITIEEVNYKPV
jgi:DNA-binding CsgD family transcriptional regulator